MLATIARLALANWFLVCVLDTLAVVTTEPLARARHFDVALFAAEVWHVKQIKQ